MSGFLPFSYAVRNLTRDPGRLLQTIGGSALVVLLLTSAAAMNNGMEKVLSASGSEKNVILLGAGSEESVQRSEVAEKAAGVAEAAIPGVADVLGRRAVSPEIHFMTYLTKAGQEGGGDKRQGLFRGVVPEALLVHREVRVVEGGFPASGELMVGRLAWRTLGYDGPEALRPGDVVEVEGVNFAVSGIFAAPGTVMESEIWALLGDLRAISQRDTLSCVVLRMDEADGFSDADLFTKQRLDLELSAVRESTYYETLAAFFKPIRLITWVTAILISAGAVFGGINTLYAAFAARRREAAALQAVGFTRTALLLSFVQESLLACLLGTLFGFAVVLLVLDGVTIPFSIGAFKLAVTPGVAVVGLVSGLLLGALGAIPPAARCLLAPLPVALRSD